MKEKKTKKTPDFDHLFGIMLKEKNLAEVAVGYLCEVKGIDRGIIYNELLPKKLIGYCPERKALAFPLMRGFVIVGIQYLTIETAEVAGTTMNEGLEYCHQGSDLETGLFSMQKNFKEVIITSGILDLLSTGMGGVSVPSLTNLSQLQLFSDMNATICFKNAANRDAAVESALDILPTAQAVALPKEFADLNQLLLAKGPDAVKKLLIKSDTTGTEHESSSPKAVKAYDEVLCRYFPDPGPHNTDAALEAAKLRAKARGIEKILISSCSGATARRAVDFFEDSFSIIVVTHVTGFKEPNYQELPQAERVYLLSKGVHVLTAQHAFAGVGRAFRNLTGTFQIDEAIAYTLRTFGQGTKVAIEIALMAADAGLIDAGEEVISLGGTVQGVDTAILLRADNTHHFFDVKVKEVICKPFSF
ncbi:MAG: pyruvate kinase alpha/beta domain-containing protein [Thermodesulfobacteriota bacterium]